MRHADARLALLAPEKASETLREAIERWRASRVDVTEATRVLHRVALNRVIPVLGDRRVDEITTADVDELVTTLAEKGKRRETIRKSVKYLAAVLDECGREPNPARSKSIRLPHEEYEEISPPAASHVEAVYERVDDVYKLPLLLLDWSGRSRVLDLRGACRRLRPHQPPRPPSRVDDEDAQGALDRAARRAGDSDRAHARRRRRRPDLPGKRDALRTAIARACRDAGVTVFSPHDLRHRRISLLHHQGRSWAEIARFVGQRKLSLTADVYKHVLSDGRELDYAEVLA